MYRSKDEDFMDSIKKRVLTATKGQEREERKYAIDYLKKHVKVDDLYKLAIKRFPNKELELGRGSYNPVVVVLTKDPITDEHVTRLTSAWRKLGLTEDDVFYAHLRFVKTKKKQDKRKDIVEKLINILSPELLVTFDNVSIDYKKEQYEVKADISILTDANEKPMRKTLTSELRKYKKQSII